MELYKIFAIINRAIKGLHCILSPARRKAKPMLTHRHFDHYEQVLMKSTEIFPLKQIHLKSRRHKCRPFSSVCNMLITGLNFVVHVSSCLPHNHLAYWCHHRIVYETHHYILNFHHFPLPRWHRQVKSFLVRAKNGCWWSADTRSQVISTHAINSVHFDATNS